MDKKPKVINIGKDEWVLVEVEELSLSDEFIQWKPRTKSELETKQLIMQAINFKIENFYRPKYDPSLIGEHIQFVSGKKPAIGKSFGWWRDVAEKYAPESNSRLGNIYEYGAFLGVLIKKLVEEGKSLEWAWNAVCNHSCEIGHYRMSQYSESQLKHTGSRGISDFYDLANTQKIVNNYFENDSYYLVSGCFENTSRMYPVARTRCFYYDYSYITFGNYVGWIVLS